MISRRSFITGTMLGAAGLATGAFLAGCGDSRTAQSASSSAAASSSQASSASASASTQSSQAETPSTAAPSSQTAPSSQAATSSTAAASSSADATVVYFSATGTTRGVAETLAGYLGVSAQEIVPAAAYTAQDLDYNTEGTRATVEARDATARPELTSTPAIPSSCQTVYLGYPIWWGDAASPLRTYVEQVDLSGKTVIPFCTSGGSGIAPSVATLSSLAPEATWMEGRRLAAGASADEVASLCV